MTVSTAQHICILYPTYFKNPQPFASSSSKKKEKEQEEKKMKEKDRDKEEEEKDKYYDSYYLLSFNLTICLPPNSQVGSTISSTHRGRD